MRPNEPDTSDIPEATEEWFQKAELRVPSLAGKKLRYLIGADDDAKLPGDDGEVTVVPYGAEPARLGISVGYCNLFLELYSEMSPAERRRYAPFLHSSDTAEEYGEGQIDPTGPGWSRNLTEQFKLRQSQGFRVVELDNPDAYAWRYVQGAINLAAQHGLSVIAKNPMITSAPLLYLKCPLVVGAIVEKGAGSADGMHDMRVSVGKPLLPVWFVAFDKGKSRRSGWTWAKGKAKAIQEGDADNGKAYRNMGVTYSFGGEYTDVEDVQEPLTS